ncbi:MAG: NAD(P)H-binding protein [Clostridia bacterium]
MTGITGHSGQFAIERLAQRREELGEMRFRAMVRPTSDISRIRASGLPIELFIGDLLDDACLKKALQDVDTLLHIVGIMESPRVLRFAAEAGVKRAILVHTTGIYSKYKVASSDYLAVDAEVTKLAADQQIDLTILRPTMIYGGMDDQNVIKFIRMVDRLPIIPVVSGARFVLQPVHRRDLGYAYTDVLLAPGTTSGKCYVLSGKAPIQLRDMLCILAEYLEKPAIFFSVPYWIAITGAWALFLMSFTKVDYREKVQRLVEPRAYSHDDAARDFGYTPVDFATGVKDEVVAYRASKKQF